MKFLRKIVFGIIGVVLYLVDPRFRALVNKKKRGSADDRVRHGETVVAILNPDSNNRRIIE